LSRCPPIKPTKEPRWRISRIKDSPAVELGTVTVPDAARAIAKAIKEFVIPKPQQSRLVGRRLD
jgi:hypothetical protein